MDSDGDLIGGGEHPRVGHLPGLGPGLLHFLRPPGELPGQPQSLSCSAPLQPALRGGPETIGKVIHRTAQTRRIHHAARVRAPPGLLPTGERSGTVT